MYCMYACFLSNRSQTLDNMITTKLVYKFNLESIYCVKVTYAMCIEHLVYIYSIFWRQRIACDKLTQYNCYAKIV